MLWLSSDNTLIAFRSIFGTRFKFMRRASFYNAALAYVGESNQVLTLNRAGFEVDGWRIVENAVWLLCVNDFEGFIRSRRWLKASFNELTVSFHSTSKNRCQSRPIGDFSAIGNWEFGAQMSSPLNWFAAFESANGNYWIAWPQVGFFATPLSTVVARPLANCYVWI